MQSKDVYVVSADSGFCTCGKVIRIYELNGLLPFDKCEDCESPEMKIDREYGNSIFRDYMIQLLIEGNVKRND